MPSNVSSDVLPSAYAENSYPRSSSYDSDANSSNDSSSFSRALQSASRDDSRNSSSSRSQQDQAASVTDSARGSGSPKDVAVRVDPARRKPELKGASKDNEAADATPTAIAAGAQTPVVSPALSLLFAGITIPPVQAKETADPVTASKDSAELTFAADGILQTGNSPAPGLQQSASVAAASLLGNSVATILAQAKASAVKPESQPKANQPLVMKTASNGLQGADLLAQFTGVWSPGPTPASNPVSGDSGSDVTNRALDLKGATGSSSKTDTLVLSAPSDMSAQPIAAAPKTLAFAMRLTGNNSGAEPSSVNSAASSPSLTALSQGGAASLLSADAKSGGRSGEHSNSEAQSNLMTAYTSESAPSKEAEANAAALPTPAATNDADVTTAANAGAEPVKNVLLQLKGDDNRRVDVRIVNSGGEMHVSVRSPDADLASRLQEHMPELTTKLDTERISSEVFLPKIVEPTKADTNASQDFLNSGNGGQSSSDSGTNSQNQSQQGKGRPDWVDLLESQNN